MSVCSLAAWDMETRQEPSIRVGIILPEDETHQVRLSTPKDDAYRVWLDDMSGPILQGASLEVQIDDRRLVLRGGDTAIGKAGIIRLMPEAEQRLAQGAGALVRGVVTGRGFHWQKRIHTSLNGMLEFRLHEDHLLLVNEVPLEQYLAGVLTAEMSGNCPVEYLKTQVVVARSWVLAFTENKHPDLPFDRCNDDDCQRYHGTTSLTPAAVEAVRATRGQVLVDASGEVIDANYSKSCGGVSETPENTWSVAKAGLVAMVDAPTGSQARRFFPVTEDNLDEYLTGSWLAHTDIFCSPAVVPDDEVTRYIGKVDERGNYFRWQIHYDREDLEQVLRDKFFARQDPGKVATLSTLMDIRVTRRGLSGRAIAMDLEYLDPMRQIHLVQLTDQHKIRDALHEKFLYSSAFRIDIERDPDGLPRRITLTGAGWGHGVGMCQIGALGMALKGYTCEQIVRHYFEGIDIYACY
ncbi:MAG TPA: SpoIID/LytB domain-containing protein [Phycisphaerae bacterium]|nr:SpoIID/LytB domain-containing protein [Phycisphaerae bacterium]HRY71030.1 SpoIID/LytB domain-containing protein [Phycisphaerae bacterium]HSA29358.1 SpoIID/LytB domain-containing protein [Phycisphaerae bacterium]